MNGFRRLSRGIGTILEIAIAFVLVLGLFVVTVVALSVVVLAWIVRILPVMHDAASPILVHNDRAAQAHTHSVPGSFAPRHIG
jgi:hypothetical protein